MIGQVRAWALVLVSAAAVAGCSSSSGGGKTAEPFDVSGTLTLSGRIDLLASSGAGTSSGSEIVVNPSDNSCAGENGFNDIKEGAQVSVADAAGKTVALGKLGAGTYPADAQGIDTKCTFTFDVAAVPAGKKFYKLTIAGRGGTQYTESDLQAGPSVTLGS